MAIKFTGDYVEWGGDSNKRVHSAPHSPMFCVNRGWNNYRHLYPPMYHTDNKSCTLIRGRTYFSPIFLGINTSSHLGNGNSENTHITVTGMSLSVASTNSGPIQMLLYTSAGFRPHQKITLTQIVATSTGAKEGNFSSSVDLPAGWYWVAVSARSGSGNPSINGIGYNGNATSSSFPTQGAHGKNAGAGLAMGRYGGTLVARNSPTDSTNAGSPNTFDPALALYDEDDCPTAKVGVIISTADPN